MEAESWVSLDRRHISSLIGPSARGQYAFVEYKSPKLVDLSQTKIDRRLTLGSMLRVTFDFMMIVPFPKNAARKMALLKLKYPSNDGNQSSR